MRRKGIALLLVAILVCALAACGSAGQKPDDPAPTQTESVLPSDTKQPEQTTSAEDTDAALTDADSSLSDTELGEINTSPAITDDTQPSSENPPQKNEISASEPIDTALAEPEPPAPIQTPGTGKTDNQNNMEGQTEMEMNVEVGGTVFSATLESNTAVDALVEMMREAPVAIQMSDYSGFEKVGSLGTSLPASDSQTTTHAGDIVLYNGNQIVIFYGSNSWSYTRLGHIDDLTGWEEALGGGDVTATFSLQ